MSAIAQGLARQGQSSGTARYFPGSLTFVYTRSWAANSSWYNEFFPHMSLGGKTPEEVYNRMPPVNRSPRFEMRTAWPRASPCAAPQTLVKEKPGVRLEPNISFLEGRKHLPHVKLRRVA
jgi:hypothetical protein